MRGLVTVLGGVVSVVSVVLALASMALSGCGGTPRASVPVDSPLRPWQAPEPAEPEEASPEGQPDDDDQEAPAPGTP